MMTRTSSRAGSNATASPVPSATSFDSRPSSRGEATIVVGGDDVDYERPAKKARVSSSSQSSEQVNDDQLPAADEVEDASTIVYDPDALPDSSQVVEEAADATDAADVASQIDPVTEQDDGADTGDVDSEAPQPSVEQQPVKRRWPGGRRGRGGKRPKGWNLRRANKQLLANGRMPSLPPDEDVGQEAHSPPKNQAGGILDRLPGRRRAPHENPLVEADMRRQLELKVAYRAVVKALKPLLIELSDRAIKELDEDVELYKRYDEYDDIMSSLDLRLEDRLQILTAERSENESLIEREFEAQKSIIHTRHDQILQDIIDKSLLECELDFLSVLRNFARDDDEEATDDEHEVVTRQYKAATKRRPRRPMNKVFESRSRVGILTDKLWHELESRHRFGHRQYASERESFVRHPKGFAVYDGEVRAAAEARLGVGALLDASEEVELIAQQAAREAESKAAVGLQALANASEIAVVKSEQEIQAESKPRTSQSSSRPGTSTGRGYYDATYSPSQQRATMVKRDSREPDYAGHYPPPYGVQPPLSLQQPHHNRPGHSFQSILNPAPPAASSPGHQILHSPFARPGPGDLNRDRMLAPAPHEQYNPFHQRMEPPPPHHYYGDRPGTGHGLLPPPPPQYGPPHPHDRYSYPHYGGYWQQPPPPSHMPPPPASLPHQRSGEHSHGSATEPPPSPSTRVKTEDPELAGNASDRNLASSSGSGKRGSRDGNILPALAPAQPPNAPPGQRPLQPADYAHAPGGSYLPPAQPVQPSFIQPHALPNMFQQPASGYQQQQQPHSSHQPIRPASPGHHHHHHHHQSSHGTNILPHPQQQQPPPPPPQYGSYSHTAPPTTSQEQNGLPISHDRRPTVSPSPGGPPLPPPPPPSLLQPGHQPRHNSLPISTMRAHPGQKLGQTPLLPRAPPSQGSPSSTSPHAAAASPPPSLATALPAPTFGSPPATARPSTSEGSSQAKRNSTPGSSVSLRWQTPKSFGPPAVNTPKLETGEKRDGSGLKKEGSTPGAGGESWPGFGKKTGLVAPPPPPPPSSSG